MTRFQIGDRVRSRVNAQGLVAGHEYRVCDVLVRALPFGDYVTYVVRADDAAKDLHVGNAHLLLEDA